MNINEKIYSVIKKAYPDLKNLQDDYFVIGSCALILSGVKIENTSDIDIVTSNKNANYLKKIWEKKLIKDYVTTQDDLFRSNFSRYDFGVLAIEIMGNLEVRKNKHWKPLIIQDYTIFSQDEIQIKLPTIEEQKRILKWFGRDKDLMKLKLIE